MKKLLFLIGLATTGCTLNISSTPTYGSNDKVTAEDKTETQAEVSPNVSIPVKGL
jgi:hypothetical protein